MELKNLNDLVKNLKTRYMEKFINAEIVLPEEFKTILRAQLAKSNMDISYLSHTTTVTTKTNQKIFFPNQWFVLAEYFADYVIELEKYKEILKVIALKYGYGFWDKIKDLKNTNNSKIDSKLDGLLDEYLDTQDKEYMIKFITSYDWWEGSKTIDRGDYFVSPILNMLNVINVSHSFLADLVYLYAKNIDLRVLAFQLCENAMKKEEAVDIPKTEKVGGRNIIIYGAPGTGKSFEVNKRYENIIRVVFHAEYSYYDFVGSYKPVPVYKKTDATLLNSDNKIANEIAGEPLIDYRFVPGPFITAIVNAFLKPNEMHTLIIEELNRGNAASIFGEMFQLLDRTESGRSEYPIRVSKDLNLYLQSIEKLKDYFTDAILSMPPNLNIVATMNSADQGVFVLDSAFKRRWNYEYVRISDENIPHGDISFRYASKDVKWKHFIKALNQRLLDQSIEEDRLIGPFFIKPDEIENVKNITSKLFLYLWDDVLRHKRKSFFSEDIKSYTQLIDAYFNGEDVFLVSEIIEELRLEENKKDNESEKDMEEMTNEEENKDKE